LRGRIQTRYQGEQRYIMTDHLLQRCGRVVMEIRSRFANAAEVRVIHHPEVGELAGEQEPARI
jgi:hypothetical protein